MADEDGVISVFPNTVLRPHTTRAYDFIGMTKSIQRNLNFESQIIIGLLDTGIYTDAPSFHDQGFSPPPAKWKGTCDKGPAFSGCNNKVIGARYYREADSPLYSNDTLSPVDTDGHGTHTSSIAAGVPISTSFYGLAGGVARGGVPLARIAMYKVCWPDNGCSTMNLLAAFDDAINDGVDLISASIGDDSSDSGQFNDPITIGAFHAFQKGILTVCSAGNNGPVPYSVLNVAPWILTVGASNIDRQFVTEVSLGNGKRIQGVSVNIFSPEKTSYPLISGAQASIESGGSGTSSGSSCYNGTLESEKVKGKIVYCRGGDPQVGASHITIKELGGAGIIVQQNDDLDTAFTLAIPGAFVNYEDGENIEHYINSTKDATAVIQKTKTVEVGAPFVASFSSRGPSSTNDKILKPDITAPGVNILAGWSRLNTITEYEGDDRKADFNILSGTSMACPLVAAGAAYVKTFHPDWSPAAIKSALMTTATEMRGIHKYDTELAYGSGNVDPVRALDPGLVYDITPSSYISFLCREGFNFSGCSNNASLAQGLDGLNYPSMQVHVSDTTRSFSTIFYRTVKNVDNKRSTYTVTVKSSKHLSISVVPSLLTFDAYEMKSFQVIVKGRLGRSAAVSGSIEWKDPTHRVRSPIFVYVGQYQISGGSFLVANIWHVLVCVLSVVLCMF
ncbi:subtilisin-like protease SBT4.14 [Thalictrum thalictroides]|uniref:Subtilisin-like protease SBT4.14 n=1 Tax=Thalictrum thalictroides TaxID=46969 RepID=A0A7J6WIQ5_THATH|nr:subtilisin-like protease SBT4.14 [Thalictrum thalictroides]